MISMLPDAYFQNALAASLFGGSGIAIIGVFLTLMQVPFLGLCMSHAAFLGAVVALLLGLPPMFCAMLVCTLTALAVGPLAERSGASANVTLSVLFSATMGLSLVLLSRLPGPKTEALNLIWGSLLTVTRVQAGVLLLIFTVLLIFIRLLHKEILAVLFSREIAAAGGMPDALIYYGVILLGGLAIGAALDMIGGLLIFALLVNPAGAARQLTRRLTPLLGLAAFFGMSSCLLGLAASYLWDIPTGGGVVLASSGIFLAALAVRRCQDRILGGPT